MPLTFKEIIDISTAWGNLTKIQDATTGVILWQKKTVVPSPTPTPTPETPVVEDGYPKLIPVLNNQYAKYPPDIGTIYNAHEMYGLMIGDPGDTMTSFGRLTVPNVNVGDVISFPYANNKDEVMNILTKGHSDSVNVFFEWEKINKTHVGVGIASNHTAYSGIATSAELPDLPDFLTIEKSGENSVVIKSIKNISEYSSYLAALNAKYPDVETYQAKNANGSAVTRRGYPKSGYPYFVLQMLLSYYSTSLGIGYSLDTFVEFRYFLPR